MCDYLSLSQFRFKVETGDDCCYLCYVCIQNRDNILCLPNVFCFKTNSTTKNYIDITILMFIGINESKLKKHITMITTTKTKKKQSTQQQQQQNLSGKNNSKDDGDVCMVGRWVTERDAFENASCTTWNVTGLPAKNVNFKNSKH